MYFIVFYSGYNRYLSKETYTKYLSTVIGALTFLSVLVVIWPHSNGGTVSKTVVAAVLSIWNLQITIQL